MRRDKYKLGNKRTRLLDAFQSPHANKSGAQSGRRSLHPHYTCIAVLQCDTNQEPSLEEIVSTHITLALQYCSVTQIRSPVKKKTFITPPTNRSPVWRRNCSAHEYQSGEIVSTHTTLASALWEI